MNSNETHEPVLLNGAQQHASSNYGTDNFNAWELMASDWETFQSHEGADGNDMFVQCLLPAVAELAGIEDDPYRNINIRGVPHLKAGDRVLDLGAGSGILARMFAKKGANVVGLDFSEEMLRQGRIRAEKDKLPGEIIYDKIDLMDYPMMEAYMKGTEWDCHHREIWPQLTI